jgi:hypothetical protein
VGFFNTSHYNDQNQTPIAYVAAIQEHGAPSAGVPARPFMRPTIDRESQEWKNAFKDGVKAVLKGDVKAENVLEIVGRRAASDVQYTISTIQEPPLSKVTLLARKFKKQNGPNSIKSFSQILDFINLLKRDPNVNVSGVSTKPLNDTGALLAAVQSQVEKV